MRTCVFVAVVAVLCSAAESRADKKGPPTTRKIVVPGSKYVFIMLAPIPLEKELQHYGADRDKETVKTIRETYAKSGLYKNDGTADPLWTVDWYGPVLVASDGVHVVRYGQPTLEQFRDKTAPPGKREVTENDLKEVALSLFAKGKLVREFTVGDFVDDRKALPTTVTFFRWQKQVKFVEDDTQLEVVTLDGNRIVIDVATGKIIEKKQAK